MSFDPVAVARKIAGLGTDVSPSVLEASQAIYAPYHEREPYEGVRLSRDVRYGPHERQRLDVLAPDAADGAPRPVLVFLHGGGFVAGDKHRPGTPYNDNVALWAVRNGLVGVNMTYRLVPEARWPSGGEDVAAALAWIHENVAQHGGAPGDVYVMGTSAGAVHVGTYLTNRALHLDRGVGVAGAILVSGAYDLATFEHDRLGDYLGGDRALYAERSSIRGLVEEEVPTLFVLAEFDPPAAERQTLELVNAHWQRHGRWPRLVRLLGHNHFSATLHMNTPDDAFGGHIRMFTRSGGSLRPSPAAPR